MNKKASIFVLILLWMISAASAAEKKYNIYVTQQHDTIENIAKRLLPSHQTEYGNHIEEYINDLKFWNPHVKNWKIIPEYTQIYVDYPYPPYPAPELSIAHSPTPLTEEIEAESVEEFQTDSTTTSPGAGKLFLMLTLSQGTFDEKLPADAGGLKTQQNSPLTLGFGGNYLFSGQKDMLVTSAYLSLLRQSEVSDGRNSTTPTIKVPNEIGINTYLQHFMKEFDFSIYEGLDYEKFSSFNTTEYVQQGTDLAVNTNSIILGTVGLAKSFTFLEQKILTKISVAKILNSTSSAGAANSFSGQRFLFFASLKGAANFSYNFLYKRHILKGPTNLTVDRIGIGLSYDLF